MHIIRRQQSQDLCSFLLISAPFLDQSSPHLYDRIIYTNPTLANSLMKLVPLEQCIFYIYSVHSKSQNTVIARV